MDLIYADEKLEDIGVLKDYSLDLAYGSNENDFELCMNLKDACLQSGYVIYADGTEYGGVVDEIQIKSESKEIKYIGRTWQGVLAERIIEPDAGSDYLILSGKITSIINILIRRIGLQDFFYATDQGSDDTVVTFQFDRYVTVYEGITKMLSQYQKKVKFVFIDCRVNLQIDDIIDYSKSDDYYSIGTEYEIDKKYNYVNHLICLGKGELKDRQVIHLYADKDRNIRKYQTFFGLDEITEIYDYSSADSVETLESEGVKKFKDLIADAQSSVCVKNEMQFGIGDIVSAWDETTNTSVYGTVTKKIIALTDKRISIEYKIGDE